MTSTVGTSTPLVGSGAPVELPGGPAVGGLVVRHWRDEDDLAALVEAINGCWAADGIEERTAVANESSEMRHLTGFDVAGDIILVELGERPVGAARINVDIDDDAVRRHWTSIWLVPAGRGLGLEASLLAWAEGRHREIAAADGSAARRRLGAWAGEQEPWWLEHLKVSGYEPARYFTDMVRPDLEDLPDRPLPAGLEVRPVRPEDMRRVLAADDEAFRDHWGHHQMTEDDIVGWIEHPYTDPALWIVAWDGDEIAGFVLASVMKDENAAFGWKRGWLGSVGTRRPWRNRGLASALMVRTMEAFRARGLTSAALGVDTENPHGALGLYERLGFRAEHRFVILFKPFEPG